MLKIVCLAVLALPLLSACSGGGAAAGSGAAPSSVAAPAASFPGSEAQAKPAFRAIPHLDQRSMTMFPAVFEGLQLREVKSLGGELGDCMNYAGDDPASPNIDIFVYGSPNKERENGADNPEVKRAFNAALSEISALEAKGVYKHVSFGPRRRVELPCGAQGGFVSALSARVSYGVEGRGRLDSFLLLTSVKGCFVKLRATLPASKGSDVFFDKLSTSFAALLFKSGTAPSVDPEAKAAVLSAVDALERDPEGLGVMAAPAILSFARESDAVVVSLTPASLPWIAAGERIPKQELLLAAFVGGNLRRQLADSKLEDSPVDGARCVFKVYSKLRETDPSFRSPSIERLMRLDAEGKLPSTFLPAPAGGGKAK